MLEAEDLKIHEVIRIEKFDKSGPEPVLIEVIELVDGVRVEPGTGALPCPSSKSGATTSRT